MDVHFLYLLLAQHHIFYLHCYEKIMQVTHRNHLLRNQRRNAKRREKRKTLMIYISAIPSLSAVQTLPLLFGKTSPHTTPELSKLQKRLIYNGFRLLKPNGVLVYSTCSFCTAQNEEVVQSLLDMCPSARVLPVTINCYNNDGNGVQQIPWDKGFLEYTVRFYPRASGTSGMFIAKITKIDE